MESRNEPDPAFFKLVGILRDPVEIGKNKQNSGAAYMSSMRVPL